MYGHHEKVREEEVGQAPARLTAAARRASERLLTAQQIQDALGVKMGTLYRAHRLKRISAYKFGIRGALRFRLSEILAELKKG